MILYCNFTFPLEEDGKLDKQHRDMANNIILEIRKTILNGMSKEELLDLNVRRYQDVPVISCTEKLINLQKKFINTDGILFITIDTDVFGIIHFGIDLAGRLNYEGSTNPREKILVISGISTDQILRMQDILFLFIKEHTILHELIHCLDYKRINKDIKTIKYDGTNDEDYYNSPKEFNAWSQEIYNDIENGILRTIKPCKVTLNWVYDFFKKYLDLPGQKTDAYKHFIEKLTKKNKARFLARLYNNFTQIWFEEENK
ncbi:MAG: hypothetical protein MJ156_02690 [Alphaproteobacteria bacterium]|nr:hypothetical protein [Alphaproteobacteria bacterium]